MGSSLSSLQVPAMYFVLFDQTTGVPLFLFVTLPWDRTFTS